MSKAIKISEVSVLCQNCTKVKECLKDRLKTIFMGSTTYCTRFDSKDKSPRLFPLLQTYELECQDAEFIYHKSKKYEKNTL